jgi:hypothetical protein
MSDLIRRQQEEARKNQIAHQAAKKDMQSGQPSRGNPLDLSPGWLAVGIILAVAIVAWILYSELA